MIICIQPVILLIEHPFLISSISSARFRRNDSSLKIRRQKLKLLILCKLGHTNISKTTKSCFALSNVINNMTMQTQAHMPTHPKQRG